MALSGQINADFKSFVDACAQAVVSLKGFDTETKNVEKSLNRMVDQFSGRPVQTQAALMVEAVERIGGASKLTEDELQKVARVAAEAAEKMRAMGEEVPDKIQKYADQLKGAETSTSGFSSVVSSTIGVLGAFGIALGVDALIGFVRGAISSAAALGDLSIQTGVTTEDLQKLGYVGAGFGATTEDMAKGVAELSGKLAAGTINDSLAAMGLNINQLKAAGPTEAFLQFAEAAARIEDPMTKGKVLSEAFGEVLGRKLNPGLKDLREAMANVPQDAIISQENIDNANQFEGAVDRALVKLRAWTIAAAGAGVIAVEKLGEAMATTAGGPMDQLTFGQIALAEANRNAAKDIELVADKYTAWQGPQQQVLTGAQMLENELKALREKALEPLTAAQQANIIELDKYGKGHDYIAEKVGASAAAVKVFLDAEQEAAEGVKDDAANMKAAIKSLTEFRDAADKRQTEIANEEKKRALERAARINTEVAAELAASIKRNELFGLDAMGNVKVTDATDKYRQAIEALHKTKEEGVSQAVREQAILDEYTTDEIKAAKAVDEATQAFWKARDAVKAKGDEVEVATKKTGVYMNQLHMLVSDPKLAAFFGGNVAANTLYSGGQGGFTPEEAAAIGAGQFINFAGGGFATGRFGFGTQGRAGGGPVSQGRAYVVGETGPELFVPSASGSVVPGAAGSSIVINITQPLGTPEAIARAVGDALTTRSRAIGQRL